MKKILFAIITISLFTLMITTSAVADGYKVWGIGARTIAKGGAFIGQADDWTAIHYNPAGLSQLKGVNISIEPGYLFLKVHDSNSVKNYTAAGSAGANYSRMQGDCFLRIYNIPGLAVEPAQFTQKKAIFSNLSPSTAGGGYFSLGPATIGFGVTTPAGLVTDWDDEAADIVNGARIVASFYNKLIVTSYNVSAATKIGPNASFGVGVNFLTFDREIKVEKTYTKISPNPIIADYRSSYKEKANGFGVEPIGGFLVKMNDKLRMGFVYRFGAKIKANGKARAIHTHPAINSEEDSHYNQTYFYPSSFGIGLCYTPTEKLAFTLDWERTDWRKLNRKLDFAYQGPILNDLDIGWEWGISDQVSFGTEYEPFPWLVLRGGVRYDESPQSKNTVSITNVYDIDKVWFTTGLGFKKDNVSVDVAYAYTYGEDKIRGVKYTLLAHNVVVGVRYNF